MRVAAAPIESGEISPQRTIIGQRVAPIIPTPIIEPFSALGGSDSGTSGAGGGSGLSGGMANPPSPPSPRINTTADPLPVPPQNSNDPFSGETSLTDAQKAQISQVIASSIPAGQKIPFGTLENTILSKLQALGWTPSELQAASQGLSASEPHGAGFIEQTGGGFVSAAARDWGSNVISALTSFLGIQNKPPASGQEPGQGDQPKPTQPTQTQQPPDNLLAGSGQISVPGSGSIASMVPVATSPTSSTTGGVNGLALLAIIGALALIGFFIWKSNKKHPQGTGSTTAAHHAAATT